MGVDHDFDDWDRHANPKIDVIVPTADKNEWPASSSLRHNRAAGAKHGKDIRFIVIESSGKDFHFAGSINRGIAQARSDANVLLLNDDCFLDSWWPMGFQSAVQCHPESVIFGAVLRFPRFVLGSKDGKGNVFSGRLALNHRLGSLQHAGGFIPTTKRESIMALLRFATWNQAPFWAIRQLIGMNVDGTVFPGHYHSVRPGHRLHLITAAAMLITPKGLERLQLDDSEWFDHRFYPTAFEDTDFCLRALEAGFRPCLVSNVTGEHYESLSTRHLEARKQDSYRVLCSLWPKDRLRRATDGINGIIHPKFCGCGEWVE